MKYSEDDIYDTPKFKKNKKHDIFRKTKFFFSSCKNKKRFKNLESAKQFKTNVRYKYGSMYYETRTYHCLFCNGYHLTRDLDNQMNLQQQLISDKWDEFPPDKFEHPCAQKAYQITIKDENLNRLYFIQGYYYIDTTIECKDKILFDTCFYLKNQQYFYVNITFEINKDIKDIYEFFKNIYEKLECIPDIYNN